MLTTSIITALVVATVPFGQDPARQEISSADDPLIKLTSTIIDRAFERGKEGIREYVYTPNTVPDSGKEANTRRLDLIDRFADGFLLITRAKTTNPASPWAFVTKSDFRFVRLKDERGNAKNEVVVRFNVPPGMTITSTIDGKPYKRIEWHLTFHDSDGRLLIDSVEQTFTNTINVLALLGRDIPLQCNEWAVKDFCVISSSALKTAWFRQSACSQAYHLLALEVAK